MRMNSQIVPVAFWIGFLALGFATNVVGLGHDPQKQTARRPVAGHLDSAKALSGLGEAQVAIKSE